MTPRLYGIGLSERHAFSYQRRASSGGSVSFRKVPNGSIAPKAYSSTAAYCNNRRAFQGLAVVESRTARLIMAPVCLCATTRSNQRLDLGRVESSSRIPRPNMAPTLSCAAFRQRTRRT